MKVLVEHLRPELNI